MNPISPVIPTSNVPTVGQALEDGRIPGQGFRAVSSEPSQGQYPPQRTHRAPSSVMVPRSSPRKPAGIWQCRGIVLSPAVISAPIFRDLPHNKGIAMALLFRSSVDSEARWKPQLARLMPELEVRIWPEIGDPAEIDYALVWRPEPGLLASLPNLKLILSLGAGVDHILTDPHLPRGVPIRPPRRSVHDGRDERVRHPSGAAAASPRHRLPRPAGKRDLAGARPEERGRARCRHSRLRRARTAMPDASSRGWVSMSRCGDAVKKLSRG